MVYIDAGIRKIRCHYHHGTMGMLKFPVEGGTVTLRSSRIIPMECAMISGPSTRPLEAGKILEEKIRVAIHPEYPEQTIAIGSTLTEKGRKELCTLLGQNLDVFAWKPADMTGVPRSIAEHCLNIREGCRPVRQKKRRASTGKKQSNPRRSGKTGGYQDHERSSLPQLAIQPSNGQEA
ncbi:hypothetical protein Tco_1176729 [Tanacetum coccineum]